MIRLATIGRGPIVDRFIEGARISGEYELCAVYSRNLNTGSEFALKHGCNKVYTDLEQMAEDAEIDAVYIASPNICHAVQSEIMLNGKKHVICEKPIATSADEYKRVKAIADSKGLIYMEAIIPRYVTERDDIVKAIRKIGNICMARINYCQLTSRYEQLKKGEQVNIFDMSLAAGALMDLGVYSVYAAVDLLGIPNTISASASFLENGADSGGTAVFAYDKFTAAVTYSKVGEGISPSEITGDKGSVIIGGIGLYQEAFLVTGNEKIPLTTLKSREELMSCEAVKFADFINGVDIDTYNSASELCFKVHTCMDKIKESAKINYFI